MPVASTPVGIAPQVIQPGVNGFLASADDEHSLAAAIDRTLGLACQQDPMKIRASVSDFGWERMASMHLDAYFSTINANANQRDR